MSLTFASSIPRGAIIGQQPTFGIVAPLTLLVDVFELFNNGDQGSFGVTLFDVYGALSDQDAASYTFGAATIASIFARPIPDAWQGQTIKIFVECCHTTAALTGTGTPPDDQVRWEFGYQLAAAGVAAVDLGPSNDGTAPNEINTNLQLGTAQADVLYAEIAEIAIGVNDRFLYGRITRDANDGTNDGLSGNCHVLGLHHTIPPP